LSPSATSQIPTEEGLDEEGGEEVEEAEVVLPAPHLREQAGSPEERYARAKRQATTPLQKAALEKLQAMDEAKTACFSAKQALELTRALQEAQALEVQPRTKSQKKRSWTGLWTCDCMVWVGLFVLLLIVPIVIAASGSKDVVARSSGALLSADSRQPMAAAPVLVTRPLAELPSLPEETLRRIRGCSFSHRSAFHHIRVASLARSATGHVRIASPDGATLSIGGEAAAEDEGQNGTSSSGLRVSNFRPFIGEHSFSLGEGSATEANCTFARLTVAPDRARPPPSGAAAATA